MLKCKVWRHAASCHTDAARLVGLLAALGDGTPAILSAVHALSRPLFVRRKEHACLSFMNKLAVGRDRCHKRGATTGRRRRDAPQDANTRDIKGYARHFDPYATSSWTQRERVQPGQGRPQMQRTPPCTPPDRAIAVAPMPHRCPRAPRRAAAASPDTAIAADCATASAAPCTATAGHAQNFVLRVHLSRLQLPNTARISSLGASLDGGVVSGPRAHAHTTSQSHLPRTQPSLSTALPPSLPQFFSVSRGRIGRVRFYIAFLLFRAAQEFRGVTSARHSSSSPPDSA